MCFVEGDGDDRGKDQYTIIAFTAERETKKKKKRYKAKFFVPEFRVDGMV